MSTRTFAYGWAQPRQPIVIVEVEPDDVPFDFAPKLSELE